MPQQKPSFDEVRIFCPSMYHSGGHELEYSLGLSRSLLALGFPTTILRPEQFTEEIDVPNESIAIPSRVNSGARFNPWERVRTKWREHAIRKVLIGGKQNQLTIIHTVDYADLKVIAGLFGRIIGPTIIMLRYDHYDIAEQVEILRTLEVQDQVALVTDSHDLAELFRPELGLDLPVLHPPTHRPVALAQTSNRRQSSLKVGYFGGARISKGFEKLPALISALDEICEDVDCFVQAYMHPDDSKNLLIASVLEKLNILDFVTVETGVVSGEAYNAHMQATDIVVLPYDSRIYRAVTSGVFVEAVINRKTVLVQQNTWMENEAGRRNLPGVVSLNFSDPDSLSWGLQRGISLVNESKSYNRAWAEEHTYSALALALVSLV